MNIKLNALIPMLVLPVLYACGDSSSSSSPAASQDYSIRIQGFQNGISANAQTESALGTTAGNLTPPVVALTNASGLLWEDPSNSNYTRLGLMRLAEDGVTAPLATETSGTTGFSSVQIGASALGNATQTFTFMRDNNHGYISFASMIAPSPDWFTGHRGLAINGLAEGESTTVKVIGYNSNTESNSQQWFQFNNDGPHSDLVSGAAVRSGDEAATPSARVGMLSAEVQFLSGNYAQLTVSRGMGSSSNTLTVVISSLLGQEGNQAFPSAPVALTVPVLAAHTNGVTLWTNNSDSTMARSGIESLAEFGMTSSLTNELTDAGFTQVSTGSEFLYGGSASTAEKTYSLAFSSASPMFSFISMVAHSPDWFTGVRNLNVIGLNLAVGESTTINTIAYDAGTENDSPPVFEFGNDRDTNSNINHSDATQNGIRTLQEELDAVAAGNPNVNISAGNGMLGGTYTQVTITRNN